MRSSFTGPRPEDRVEWRAEIEDNSREEGFMTGEVLRVRGEPEIELTLYKLSVDEFKRVLDIINVGRGGSGTDYKLTPGVPPPENIAFERLKMMRAAELADTSLMARAIQAAERAVAVTAKKAQEPEPPKSPGVQDRFSGLDIT